ncbi:hypothetical protein [Mesorhizobium sp. Pch-S]|uniref:hypothetical protein n=1 Tax=Mesorhizobium sp. Pch-S TaxID=2082387 RepID=UPI001010FD2C|nr:hypothetical protein [Mesorhizobium sp. Pch-S]
MSESHILFPDLKPLPCHRDKNGREIRYCKLQHDNGKIYDLFGTGKKMPGDGETIMVWTPDNKLAIVNTKDIVVYAGDNRGFLIGLFIFLFLLALAVLGGF